MDDILTVLLIILGGFWILVHLQGIILLALIIGGLILAIYVLNSIYKLISSSASEWSKNRLEEKRRKIKNQYSKKIADCDREISELIKAINKYEFSLKVAHLLNLCDTDSNNKIIFYPKCEVSLTDGTSLQDQDVASIERILNERKEQRRVLIDEQSHLDTMSEYKIDELYKDFFHIHNKKFQQRKKLACYGLAIVLFVSAGVITYVYYIKPKMAFFVEVKLSEAETLWGSGNKIEAIDLLSSVTEEAGYDSSDVILATEKKKEYEYSIANDYMKANKYKEAKDIFTALGTYEDSKEMAFEAEKGEKYSAAIKSLQNKNYLDAQKAFCDLDEYKDSDEYEKLSNSYILLDNADKLYDKDWKEAIKIYDKVLEIYGELGETFNCEAKAIELRYELAVKLVSAGRYGTAKKYLEVLTDYKGSDALLESVNEYMAKYESALVDYENGDYEKVLEDLEGLGNYKKTSSMRKEAQKKVDYANDESASNEGGSEEVFDIFGAIEKYNNNNGY